MPDTSNSHQNNEITLQIASGNYSDDLVTAENAKQVLDTILFGCDARQKCDDEENLMAYGLMSSFIDNSDPNDPHKFYHILDFLSKVIPTVDIPKLFLALSHYYHIFKAKLTNNNTNITENDISMSESHMNILSQLLKNNDIANIETGHLVRDIIVVDNLPNFTLTNEQDFNHILGQSIEIINNLFTKLIETKPKISENYPSLLESIGDLGFQLKIKDEFQSQAELLKRSVQQFIISISNNSSEFKNTLVQSFLNTYHDGNSEDIAKDCQDSYEIKNCQKSDNPDTIAILKKINAGNITFNEKNENNFKLIVDHLLKDSDEVIKNRLHLLTRENKLIKYKNFLIGCSSKFSITEEYLKKSYKLCQKIFEISTANNSKLRNTDDKFDIKYYKEISNNIALVLNIVKNNEKQIALFEQIHVIEQLGDLIIDVTKNYHSHKYSNITDNSVTNLPKAYLDIINYCKDLNTTLADTYNSFAISINKVVTACLQSNACNNTQIKKQSFEILGGMTRKLEHAHRIHSAKEVINSAKELKGIIENSTNISAAELGNDVANFLRIRHSRNQILMDKDCKDLFGLNPQDCRPSTPSNTTTTSTTPISETTTNTPAPLAANTTLAPVFNQTSNFEEISTTEIIKDIVQNLGSRLPTATEIGATAAHSFGSSLINIMTQATSMWLRSKGYGESKISAISLSLAGGILQASYMATFPLMLLKLNELVADGNEEEAQAQWDMMTQNMLPIFFNTLGLSTGLQLLNYLSENYLSKQSTIKGLAQSIPTLSTLWSFSQNPILTGIHAATAYGVSAAGLFGFNRYFGARNHPNSDAEAANINKKEHGVEMGALTSSCENSSDTSMKNSETNSDTMQNNVENFPAKNLMYFIQKEQIQDIQKKLETIKLNLEHMINIYSPVNEKLKSNIQSLNNAAKETNTESVTAVCLKEISELNNIINDNDAKLKLVYLQKSILDQYIELFSDNRHFQACEGFTTAKTLLANESVKSLWGLIRTTMDNNVLGRLEKDLCKITGTDSTKLITGPDSSKNIDKLENYISNIRFSSSQTESILKAALRIYESKEQGVTAAKKIGEQNTENNEVNNYMLHDTATLRKKTNGIVLTNRACSMYSDRTRSSGSDKSDASGNSEFDPLFPQQDRELIRPKV
jgi:hypothetical protein